MDLGWLWHGLSAAVIGAAAECVGFPTSGHVLVGSALALAGIQRERRQHRWVPPWELSLHQGLEAGAWGVGYVLGVGIGKGVLWLF